MRVLHCCAPAPAGGIETVIRLLACGQRAAGHTPHVALTLEQSGESHPFANALRDAGIPAHEIVVGGRGYHLEFAALRRLAREYGSDVLHSHGFRSDALAALLRRSVTAVHISTLHGFIGASRRGRLNESLQLRALRGAAGVIAVSRSVASRAVESGVRAERICQIPNAVPAPRGQWSRTAARAELGLLGEGPVVGWIGRLSHEKGPDVFADAMARVPRLASVAVIGDGPMRRAVAERLRQAGVRAVFPGVLADASSLLPAFDVLVLSSRTEGTPMVLLEAMAAGTPIVATAVGGVPDVLTPEMARLVPAEDPSALADAIHDALSDRAGSAARADRAHARWSDQYDVPSWIAAHDAMYRAAVERSGRRL